MIVYISVGNSDDKLTQKQWAMLLMDLRFILVENADTLHGQWFSGPDSVYQNACFCADIAEDKIPELQGILAAIAAENKQDSIAFAVAPLTQFLGPGSRT